MGTYIGINLTEKTKSDITKFCYDQNILIKVNDFDQSLHSTIVYSYDKTEITLDNILNFKKGIICQSYWTATRETSKSPFRNWKHSFLLLPTKISLVSSIHKHLENLNSKPIIL